MKLLKQFKNARGRKAAQFRECLSKISRHGQDSSFLQYTREWIDAVNRGGLFVVNDETFELFKAIELITRQVLPQHLAGNSKHPENSGKEKLVELIVRDDMVQLKWRPVSADIIDDEDKNELLHRIVDMWVTIRGFAVTSKWINDYKEAKGKTAKKAKSLRNQLKESRFFSLDTYPSTRFLSSAIGSYS